MKRGLGLSLVKSISASWSTQASSSSADLGGVRSDCLVPAGLDLEATNDFLMIVVHSNVFGPSESLASSSDDSLSLSSFGA